MHFEQIWNDAEELATNIPNNNPLATIKRLREALDNMIFSQGLGEYKERNKEFGKVLFELCSFCKMVETPDNQINSAEALILAMEEVKAKLFDPDV